MAFCPQCGNERGTGDSFCQHCGASLAGSFQDTTAVTSDKGATAEVAAVAPVPASAAEPEPEPEVPRDSATEPPTGIRLLPRAPFSVIVAAALLALCGVAILVAAIVPLVDLLPALKPSAGPISNDFGIILLILLIIVGSIGVGLVAIGWMCFVGDRVGRALALIVCGIVIVSMAATSQRSTYTWVALGIASAIVLILTLSQEARTFFAHEDPRPTGVVASTSIIAYFVWDFALLGVASFALSSFQRSAILYGILLLVGSGLLVLLNARLRKGAPESRVIASLVLAGLGVVSLLVNHDSLGALILPGIAGGAIGGLWLPPASNEFFAGRLFDAMDYRTAWPWNLARQGAGVTVVAAHDRRVTSRGMTIVGILTVAAAGILVLSLTSSIPSATAGYDFGSATGTTFPTSPYTTPTYSTTPTTTGTVSDSSADAYTWTYTASAPGGYSESGSIVTGRPQHYRSGLGYGDAVLGACSGDEQTDAVVPIKLQETNTTSGYSAEIGTALSFADSGSSYSFDVDFNTGEQCESGSFNTNSVNTASPNTSVTLYGFVVVPNFYSPDYPNGEASLLTSAVLELSSSFTASETSDTGDSGTGNGATDYTVGSFKGPGAQEIYGAWEFDLAGTALPSGNSGNTGAFGGSGNSGVPTTTTTTTTVPPNVGNSGTGNSGNSGSGNSGNTG